jgi:hypothetical protein
MTLLNGSTAPTLSAEDNFSLTYHGSYGALRYERETNTNHVDRVEGPLPKGRFVWDGVDYLGGLEPGAVKLVPFDLVRLFWGDPRSVPGAGQFVEDRRGNSGNVAPREEETRRLSVFYGLYDTDSAKVHLIVPDVTIETAEHLEVITPATDPLGEHIYGHIAPSAENHDVATQIAQMKMQIKLLETHQKELERRGDDNSGADVKDDVPPNKR